MVPISSLPLTLALVTGWWAATPDGRRRLGPSWVRVHVSGVGGSLIGLYSAGNGRVRFSDFRYRAL